MPKNETVIGVIDGDTFETSSRKRPVRLANVDSPERGEEGYGAAKQKLARLIRGRVVVIQPVARDKYGRAGAIVKVGGKSVNSHMQR